MTRTIQQIGKQADMLFKELEKLNAEAIRVLELSQTSPKHVLEDAIINKMAYIGLTNARNQAIKWCVKGAGSVSAEQEPVEWNGSEGGGSSTGRSSGGKAKPGAKRTRHSSRDPAGPDPFQ